MIFIEFINWLSYILIEFLKFSREYILLYSLPTNPISGSIYVIIAYYGYTKLRDRVDFDLSKFFNKLLVFLYSFCLLGFINFNMENVWLSAFFIKYTFLNDGWLPQIYFNVPSGWFVNYLRNFVYMIILYLISRDIFKYVNFNKKTAVGIFLLSLFLFLLFILSPNYAYIDWTYAIMNNYADSTILISFLFTVCGKPLLFYLFYTVWLPKKRSSNLLYNPLTLDVGCGSRPQGDVNIDILEEGSDSLKYNIQHKRNFVPKVVAIPNLIRADARFLPFRDKVFSKSYCYHLMEHISEDWMVYEDLNRVTNQEIEIRVPLGIWEDLFNTVFWYKNLKVWRKKYHLRSYSKKTFNKSLISIFGKENVSISYGFLSFLRGLRFECERKTFFPFPLPFELVAHINLEDSN